MTEAEARQKWPRFNQTPHQYEQWLKGYLTHLGNRRHAMNRRWMVGVMRLKGEMTFREIGEQLGVSTDRACQES